MGWLIYIGGGALFYYAIMKLPDNVNPAAGVLLYFMLIAYAIGGGYIMTDGEGISDDDFLECGSGILKYDC